MKQFCFVVLVLSVLHIAYGQVPFPGGKCPPVSVEQNFKLNDYMGVWYEYKKYPFVFEVGQKCIYAIYNRSSDDTVSVMNAAINRFTGKPLNVTGTATVIASGQLSVSFPPRNTDPSIANYEVLGTDYTSYAVVYSCSPIMGVTNMRIIWVLTREQNPPVSVIEKADAIIKSNKLNTSFFIQTLQTGCDGNEESLVENGTTPDPTLENMFTEGF